MQTYPLTSLGTLLSLLVFFWTAWLVGRARTKYQVHAPAMSGHEMFERAFRIQMNTLEQLVFMLPALWLCAVWIGDRYAALGALVWCIGRIVYGTTYLKDPKKREFGFVLTITPSMVMLVAAAVFVVKSLV